MCIPVFSVAAIEAGLLRESTHSSPQLPVRRGTEHVGAANFEFRMYASFTLFVGGCRT